ncbi:MAG: ABC transporter permease [Eubacterium sp.]|nr:ABC transporter permease [Eubacterium sp.]
MLFKLALKNIKKSVKDYSIYFFTLVIGVIVFYVFNALETQTAMLNVADSTRSVIELLNIFLSGVSVFVAIILGALIIYAGNFLIKRRKKEFGVYLTLGMSKRRMSTILLTETIIIGILSLVIGLIVGTALSQFMSVAVANIFEADMTSFTFVFSAKAAIKTCVYFGIMYLIVMIFNTVSIGKCKLIDLLHGSKKEEKLKLRNPIVCLIIFIIAAVALAIDYYCVTVKLNDFQSPKVLIVILVVGAVSTFLVFWSVSGSILTIVTKMKGLYFKRLNSFVLRQFSSKANTMVMSMSVICLMLFLTIVLLGSSISLTRSLNSNLRKLVPCEFQVKYFYEEETKSITDALTEKGFDLSKLDNTESVKFYEFNDLTMADTIGEYLTPALNHYTFVTMDSTETLVSLTDYNKIARIFGAEELKLAEDEYAMVGDLSVVVAARTNAIKAGHSFTFNGHTLTPGYLDCKQGAIMMSMNKCNEGVVVVNDEVLEGLASSWQVLYADYSCVGNDDIESTENYVNDFFKDDSLSDEGLFYATRSIMKSDSIGIGALATFISLYVGIIFLIASAAILSLKELSESADNVERYSVLRRIGTDEKMINKALFSQIGMFFAFPMVLAIIHSIFGLKSTNMIFEVFGSEGLGLSIAITALIIVLIYGGYFLLTYFTSKRIIADYTYRQQ